MLVQIMRKAAAIAGCVIVAGCATANHQQQALDAARRYVSAKLPNVDLERFTSSVDKIGVIRVHYESKEVTMGGGITIYVDESTGAVIYAKIDY